MAKAVQQTQYFDANECYLINTNQNYAQYKRYEQNETIYKTLF